MVDRHCILVCEHYALEAREIITSIEFDQTTVRTFPGRCGHPPMEWNELESIAKTDEEFDTVTIIGGGCLDNHIGVNDENNSCAFHRMEQCFHMLVNKDYINQQIKAHSYLLTPGWLLKWQQHMHDWGFDQTTAREFFKEFCRQLLLLDTSVHADSKELLKEFAEFVDCTYESLPIGLGHFRLFLSKINLDWRLSYEKKQHISRLSKVQKQLSELALSLDMVGELSRVREEDEVILKIMDIFSMLFAPKQLTYLPLMNGVPGELIQVLPSSLDDPQMTDRLMNCDQTYSWTASGDGFLVRICHGNETMGILEVSRIYFPEHKEHYLNLALGIVDVCGLAIENARKYDQIKVSLREKETLLHEVHHRARNNIAVISSMLKFQARNSQDARVTEALAESNHRVQTISVIHDTLHQSENLTMIDADSYLSALTRAIFSRYQLSRRINLKVKAKELRINAKLASPLGLIVNELMTNSFRHAFPGHQKGNIEIHLLKIDGDQIELTYKDNGIGISKDFDWDKSKKTGLSLMKLLVESILHGSVELARNQGTCFVIRFNSREN